MFLSALCMFLYHHCAAKITGHLLVSKKRWIILEDQGITTVSLNPIHMKPLLLIAMLSAALYAQAQERYAIVIDEIMADPSPQVGLPNNEWIELKNISSTPINLQNWRLADASGQSGPMPSFILQPDSFVTVCTASAVPLLSAFGQTIAVTSFPSLDNDGEILSIKSATGKTMHAIEYSSAWYQNELKKDGGWTLEMIDTKNPCAMSDNWKASIGTIGGTPGYKNSVDAIITDNKAPVLLNAYTNDATTLTLNYDEPLDSNLAAVIQNYTIDKGAQLISAVVLPPLFNKVQLKTTSPLNPGIIYTVVAANTADCNGNTTTSTAVKTGLPADPASGELIINEILFNPKPNGVDYVEVYNNSTKIVDASKVYIANKSSSGTVANMKVFNSTPVYIFPGEYYILTENPDLVALQYFVKDPLHVFIVPSMPSYPDDEGSVLLLNAQGSVIDELNYKDDWHFKLISNDEGVALERIDPDIPSQQSTNWHSAASSAGYGTPTYKNSQFKNSQPSSATIEISPKIFSPDNDGFNDIARIQYNTDAFGYMANITIFDANGKVVRSLVRNEILAVSGYYNWDGLNDNKQKLTIGTYIVVTEIFNLQGKKQTFKNSIVLARRLN